MPAPRHRWRSHKKTKMGAIHRNSDKATAEGRCFWVVTAYIPRGSKQKLQVQSEFKQSFILIFPRLVTSLALFSQQTSSAGTAEHKQITFRFPPALPSPHNQLFSQPFLSTSCSPSRSFFPFLLSPTLSIHRLKSHIQDDLLT